MVAEAPSKRKGYVRTPEIRERNRLTMLGHPVSIKTKRKLSEKAKKQVHTPERDRKVSEALKGRVLGSPEKVAQTLRNLWATDKDYRRRMCHSFKGRLIGPKWRQNLSRASRKYWAKEGVREAQSKRLKAAWQNPEIRQRGLLAIAKAQHRKPNLIEQQLESVLNNHFPNQWQYTGDGKLVIGGYRPDFANRNGLKLLIELFGDYWHNRKGLAWHQTELGKIMAYHSLGFKCLVVWEKELGNEQALVGKIAEFMRSKVCSSRKFPMQC